MNGTLIRYCRRPESHGHRGVVLWLRGSPVGNQRWPARWKRRYIGGGVSTYLLGRRDLGFSDADRGENIRRVGEVVRSDGGRWPDCFDGICFSAPRRRNW